LAFFGTRGYVADDERDERDECDSPRVPKKAKWDHDTKPRFGSEYDFSEHGDSTQDNMSTASDTRRAETDTEVESACSEIEPESTDESESLRSHDTSQYESECVSETLGSSDTRSSDSSEDSGSDGFDHEDSGSDGFDHEDSGSDGFDNSVQGDNGDDALSTASTV